MSAKKLVLASLIAALLAGCGANSNQPALPGDGTYSDVVLPADDYGMTAPPEAPVEPGVIQPPVASAPAGVDGQIGNANAAGFTLRGLVTDMVGKPVPGAKVSIGAQTTLTNATGAFTISGIMDTQVWVDVSADGFDPIARFNVPFSADKATADKEFKLAPAGSGDGANGGDGSADAAPVGPRLTHEGTFSGPAFQAVVAMVADGNRVYVLGKLDKALWFDRMAVVVFDAESGEELSRVGDRLFSRVPKAATSLRIEDGQLVVTDGKERVTFDARGAFASRAAGAGFPVVTEVKDAERGLTYTLKAGNKAFVAGKDLEATLRLDNVSRARAFGLDGDGGLLVLDSGERIVHRFSFAR